MDPKLAPLSNGQPLSSLLPYDPAVKVGPRLLDGLKEYRLLLVAAQRSFEAYGRGELRQFDPLVGENACQIRAVKVALVAMERVIKPGERLREIGKALAKLGELEGSSAMWVAGKRSLRDFLENGLEVQFTHDELYLIQCYVLSLVKTINPFDEVNTLVINASTDTKKIKEISPVGSAFAHMIVRHLRVRLAQNSALFVQELALELGHELPKQLVIEHLSALQCLPCLPYYWMTRILIKQVIDAKIPIVMHAEKKAQDLNFQVIEKTTLYFQATESGYKRVPLEALDLEMPAVILLGATCRDLKEFPEHDRWITELSEYCPTDLILAHAAAHRQYPDVSKENLLRDFEVENYDYHRAKSLDWGCALKNPSRYFLIHVFCDKVGNAPLNF